MVETQWTTGAAEAAGFDVSLERKLLAGIESGLIRDVHAVLIDRGDTLVLEHYRAAPDESCISPTILPSSAATASSAARGT